MKSSFASVALFAICVSVTARAADMPVKAPLIPSPLYNWNGFYFGANIGGAWTSGSLNIPGNLHGGTTEFIGGVQAGYNFQAGHLLFGIEGDFDGATFDRPALPTPILGTVRQNWVGTLAGRFGLVEDKWLLYAKLGDAQADAADALPFHRKSLALFQALADDHPDNAQAQRDLAASQAKVRGVERTS